MALENEKREVKEKAVCSRMQNKFVEPAAFLYLKLMKEQLGAVSSELLIALYSVSGEKNTQAFKIKTLMFHLTQIHPPPEELPVSWTFLEQSNMRAFVPPTEATMKDTMTPGVHLCSLIFGRINSPAFVFSLSSKNLDQTQKRDLPTHGAEFHLKQHPLLLVTRQSFCTTHWLPNEKELV